MCVNREKIMTHMTPSFYDKYVNSKIILTPDGNNGTTLQSTPFSPILLIMYTCIRR